MGGFRWQRKPRNKKQKNLNLKFARKLYLLARDIKARKIITENITFLKKDTTLY